LGVGDGVDGEVLASVGSSSGCEVVSLAIAGFGVSSSGSVTSNVGVGFGVGEVGSVLFCSSPSSMMEEFDGIGAAVVVFVESGDDVVEASAIEIHYKQQTNRLWSF
jgi:hypothetical protein